MIKGFEEEDKHNTNVWRMKITRAVFAGAKRSFLAFDDGQQLELLSKLGCASRYSKLHYPFPSRCLPTSMKRETLRNPLASPKFE